MAGPPEKRGRPGKTRRSFATTHWSLVRAAGEIASPETTEALEKLCQIYWQPVYAHVRLWGHKPEDAQDLTQAFFTRLLEKQTFARANPDRGRFRAFLLGSLKFFLRDAHVHANAKKRGGGIVIISWERDQAEALLGTAALDHETPDRIFERRWAETILERAATRLRRDYKASGRGDLFEVLKSHVAYGRNDETLAEAAKELGLSISAIRSAVFRLRRQYHAFIRDEVAQTVENPADLDDELRYLLNVVSSSSQTS